jgi:hypothetical protein
MTKARDLASGAPAPAGVTSTELGYVDGVTSALQTQIDSKIGQSTAINPIIVDAKGDIIAATAADTVARLAVGANDTVLTADSSTATGMKWATAAGGGGWTSLATGNLTSTSTTVSITTTGYKQVVIFLKDVVCTTDWYWQLRINGDTSTNYSLLELLSNGTTTANAFSILDSSFYISGANDVTDYNTFAQWTINDPANTNTVKQVIGNFSAADNTATFRRNASLTGQWFGTPAAVTSVTFLPASTYSSGTYEIYGVK